MYRFFCRRLTVLESLLLMLMLIAMAGMVETVGLKCKWEF